MITADKIIEKCIQQNIKIETTQAEKLALYSNMVLDYNNIVNLTRNDTEEKMIDRNIIDCLRILPYIKKSDYIADIGCGAGLPGIVIAIMTGKRIVLIDSIKKKTDFVRTVIETIGLNCVVVNERAEIIAKSNNYRGMFDCVVSRATAQLNILIEYSIPLLKIDGILAAMKGSNFKKEIDESKNAVAELRSEIRGINQYKNNDDIDRSIIKIQKKDVTPEKYPRDTKKILKRPL